MGWFSRVTHAVSNVVSSVAPTVTSAPAVVVHVAQSAVAKIPVCGPVADVAEAMIETVEEAVDFICSSAVAIVNNSSADAVSVMDSTGKLFTPAEGKTDWAKFLFSGPFGQYAFIIAMTKIYKMCCADDKEDSPSKLEDLDKLLIASAAFFGSLDD